MAWNRSRNWRIPFAAAHALANESGQKTFRVLQARFCNLLKSADSSKIQWLDSARFNQWSRSQTLVSRDRTGMIAVCVGPPILARDENWQIQEKAKSRDTKQPFVEQ